MGFRPKKSILDPILSKGVHYEDTLARFIGGKQTAVEDNAMPELCSICAEARDLRAWGNLVYGQMFLCAHCYCETAETMYAQLIAMRDAYEERRSDVSESLDDVLRGAKFNPDFVPSRFIKADVPEGADQVLVDLFVNSVEARVGDEWRDLHCSYSEEVAG